MSLEELTAAPLPLQAQHPCAVAIKQPCPTSGGSLVAGEAVSLHTLPGKRAGILVRWVAIAMRKVSEAKSILVGSADCFEDHHLRSEALIRSSSQAPLRE